MFKNEPSGQNYSGIPNVYQGEFLLLKTMFQQVVVILIFILAMVYLGRMLYRAFTESDCTSGCGKCAVADFKKMQKQLKQKAG